MTPDYPPAKHGLRMGLEQLSIYDKSSVIYNQGQLPRACWPGTGTKDWFDPLHSLAVITPATGMT